MGLFHFFANGAPWAPVIDVDFTTPGDVVRMAIAGDQSECVAQDNTGTVFGLPMDGTATPNWSCALGTGNLIGSPAANRWLRVSGTVTNPGSGWQSPITDPLTIDLLDSSGSVLDTVTFTAPAGSWTFNATAGSSTVTYEGNALCWVQTTPTIITYVGTKLHVYTTGSNPQVAYRCLEYHPGTDTITWMAAEQVFDTTWGPEHSGEEWHGWASNWGGQLVVGYRLNAHG
jgi:hypothetical protein